MRQNHNPYRGTNFISVLLVSGLSITTNLGLWSDYDDVKSPAHGPTVARGKLEGKKDPNFELSKNKKKKKKKKKRE